MDKFLEWVEKRVLLELPAQKTCPHCEFEVDDWHREWYPRPNEMKLFKKQAAADCPKCGGPVDLFSDVSQIRPLDGLPILHRSRFQAEKHLALMGKSLKDYLTQSLPGRQYANYRFDP